MQPDFDFQFGRRHHLRGHGYRGLVALGLVLVALLIVFIPARATTLVAFDSLRSALARIVR